MCCAVACAPLCAVSTPGYLWFSMSPIDRNVLANFLKHSQNRMHSMPILFCHAQPCAVYLLCLPIAKVTLLPVKDDDYNSSLFTSGGSFN